MLQDVRFALRLFARRPGVTALIVSTLAIGIAASTVVFSVADAILWHPLPFRDPERLVGLWGYNPAQKTASRAIPLASLSAWDAKTQIFETVHAYGMSSSLLTGGADAQGVTGGTASLGLFAALGVHPRLGRDFLPDDFQPGRNQVVLLSDTLWRSRFAAARDIVGRALAIDGQPHTIVGVMPPGFGFPVDGVRLWVPLVADSRPSRVNAIGRMRASVSFAQAEATAEVTSRGMLDPAGKPLPEVRVRPFMSRNPNTTTAIVALLGAVALLLLIAVVNAANVLLAEAIRRDAEMSVRASLGAGMARLARQVATETLLLTTSAAILGVSLSFGTLRLVLSGLPWMMSYQSLRPIAIDWRAMIFASVTATFVGVGTAVAPIARVHRASLQSSLKGTAISATSHVRLRSVLVGMQLAITTVLLVAAGLLANGFVRMNRADVGFSPEHLLMMSVDLPRSVLPTEPAQRQFLDEWQRRAAAVPGVIATTITGGAIPPHMGFTSGPIETADRGIVADQAVVAIDDVDGAFFPTLGIPLLTGRTFDARDAADSPLVAVISRAPAERLWPAADAIGRRFRLNGDSNDTWHTVIGIVGNVGNGGFEQPLGDLAAYHARGQVKEIWRFESLVVRAAGPPSRLERPLRELTRALNPGVPVAVVETGDEVIAGVNARVRFATFLMWTLAAIATALALIGVYGAFWCSVRQRTREIGVRLALGAEPSAIIRMVLRETIGIALLGLAMGLPIAFASSRLLRGLLFGVEPTDPVTFAVASVLLVAAALAASYTPARRAGSIDPAEALRYE